MQVCRSTSTMPSARLNEAPVGQTSTQGGSAQCWHIIGSERTSPRTSLRSILRSHWESVIALLPESPFSLSQAVTHALQSLAQRFMSTRRPQRAVTGAGTSGARPCASSYSVMPGASATPASAAVSHRNFRRP
jgi:hypothetical protein